MIADDSRKDGAGWPRDRAPVTALILRLGLASVACAIARRIIGIGALLGTQQASRSFEASTTRHVIAAEVEAGVGSPCASSQARCACGRDLCISGVHALGSHSALHLPSQHTHLAWDG